MIEQGGGRRAISELRATLGKLEKALSAIDTAIVWTDAGHRVEWCNDAFARMLGKERLFILGRTVQEVYELREDGRPVDPASRPVVRALATGRPVEGEYELMGAADGPRFVRLAAFPLESTEGLSVVFVITDLTRRRRLERALAERVEELKRSNEDLEQFAYAASHDLKEPLRKIASFLELLERDRAPQLDASARSWIGHAVSGARRLASLVDDLLVYARVGRDDAAVERVSLSAAAREALDALAEPAREAGADVRIGDLPEVPGRRVQLRQLFQNLLSNALKFRAPDRPVAIDVSAAREGAFWAVTVRDNGIGIAAEHHERIFGVFKRLHTSSQYPGTGVGLALARRIAFRHGGSIRVASKPGEGTAFTVLLPAEA